MKRNKKIVEPERAAEGKRRAVRRIRWPEHNDTLSEALIRRYRRLSGENCDATHISAAGLAALQSLSDDAFLMAVSSLPLPGQGEQVRAEDEQVVPPSAAVAGAEPAAAHRHPPPHPKVRAVRPTFALLPDEVAFIDSVRSMHRERKQRITPVSQGTVVRALIHMLARMPESEVYDLIDKTPELARGPRRLTHSP